MQSQRSIAPAALLAALLAAAPLAAQDAAAPAVPSAAPAAAPGDPAQVLATVNGTDITLGHLVAARARLPEQMRALPAAVLLPSLLDQLVQQTLLAQAAGEEPLAARLAMENERRNVMAGVALSRRLETAVSEADVEAAYAEGIAGLEPVTEYDADHILVGTEEEARAVIAEIEGGADFAEVAAARSTGPSGPGGGALGWFVPDQMVAPFAEAVRALEPGEISEPVQTEFGWHVIRLNATRPREAPPLDAVRGEIAARLNQDALRAYLEELEAEATVERAPLEGIDPGVLDSTRIDE